ncbi:hypothetical protein MKUB_00550 [Mycobacterium kubicae]|uniref:ESX-1 secretion-associated protein n=1 Tax=Mycobacterium kubicae TaxID=120959 RepID=A0ABQ1BFQ1_9MYCO|nr:hypothetical protein MKUB_00550 [Mycobacterium kubicae]
MSMFANLGRGAEVAVARSAFAVHQVLDTTVLHLRRIAGAVSETLTRVTREARDLAWDYQDMAADLHNFAVDERSRANPNKRHSDSLAEVVELPLGNNRRANRVRSR